MAGNDNTTATSWYFRINLVLDSQSSGLVGILKDGSVFVIADTAEVDNAVGWQEVLCSTGSVLATTTGDELSTEVLEEVVVDLEVVGAGISEDGIIGFDVVFIEESLITGSLDIWEVLGGV